LKKAKEEVEKTGRQEYFKKIRSIASSFIAESPESDAVVPLDNLSQGYSDRVAALLDRAANLADDDDEELTRLAQELSWAKMTVEIIVARDNTGGTGVTCATGCAGEYDQCVGENGCETGGWVCICCVPCSIQYMGCMRRCILGGSGGVVLL
jgi:hypothetical protein